MIAINIIILIAIIISWIIVFYKKNIPIGEYETHLQKEWGKVNGFVVTNMGKVEYVEGDSKTREEALAKMTNNSKQVILWIDVIFCLFWKYAFFLGVRIYLRPPFGLLFEIALIVSLIMLVVEIIRLKSGYYEKQLDKEKDNVDSMQKHEMQKIQTENEYYNQLAAKITPSKVIKYADRFYVMVNEEKELILLNEHIYDFKDIINYNLNDNSTVIQHHETGTATTKTSTKSMVGRAVVGDVLLGGAGAMAGALTAKKNTEINLGDTTSTTKHDYTIVVNVNSISNPVERLHLGEDGETANDILGVLSVIMIRNK